MSPKEQTKPISGLQQKMDELYSQEDIQKIKTSIEAKKLIADYNYSTNLRTLGFILLIIIVLLGLFVLVYSYIIYPDFRENIATVLANNIVAAFIGLLIILNIYPKKGE